jgi:hypothetical protein
MRRNINQIQSKFSILTVWFVQNRIKSSVLLFVSLVVLGSVTGLIIKLTSNGQPQTASQEFEGQSIDAIPGWWYQEHFGLSVCEQDKCQLAADPDGDKLTNAQEYFYNSDPNNVDTNANGNTDGEDVAFGYVPNKPGKTTFEQAGSDDNIVGESLLFNNEVKDVIVGMTDLGKTVLPEVKESELTVIKENSQELFIDYMLALDQVSKKFYTSPDQYAGLSEQITQNNKAVAEELKLTALQVASEYKKVPVPSDALQLHKYQIALWELIPAVVDQPESTTPNLLYDSSINKWFDSAQAMIALNQKIVVELIKLRAKYEFE